MIIDKEVYPEEIIEGIKFFNRKERFYLISDAIGNDRFKLCDKFISKINNKFDVEVTENAFIAMDYHMDWISAALTIAFKSDKFSNGIYPNGEGKGRLNDNQEDVDLLIGYCDAKVCHLIMLEAKAFTGWTNKQLKSKAEKHRAVFYMAEGRIYPNVIPHFGLISINKPRNLDRGYDWPSYWVGKDGDINWLELGIPEDMQGMIRGVVRCDEEGRVTEGGDYWKVKKY